MEKRYTRNGITVLFYQKPDDDKYSFLVEGDQERTEWLLEHVKTKRVRGDKIRFALDGIFDRLRCYGKPDNRKKKSVKGVNPVSLLNELCQKKCGANIITRVVGNIGTELYPEIEVEMDLPTSLTEVLYIGRGQNQREARAQAAIAALTEVFGYEITDFR